MPVAAVNSPPTGADFVRPFMLEVSGLLGRLVRLGPVVDTVLTRHDYPAPVARLLGELLALAGTLSSMLKFEGTFSLQTKGDGPVRLMLADVTSEGALRGYADIDRARLDAALDAAPAGAAPEAPGSAELLGSGYLALTVDVADQSEPYQGIVELSGDSLADCVHHYFRQSEQLKTALKLAVDRQDGTWRAAGLLIQQMPEGGRTWAPGRDIEADEEPILGSGDEDDWRRSLALMASCSDGELLDSDLPADDLLYRLFHEERVRVYRTRTLSHGCRCSRPRIEAILKSLPRDEVAEFKVDGEVIMTCQFCNADFRFDEAALERIYSS